MNRAVVFLIIFFTILFFSPRTPKADSSFQIASPGYHYSFPRDHFSHPQFQTEWWYYTGHLKTQDGQKYGYEITFFRRGIKSQRDIESKSAWIIKDIFFAHFAISDKDREKFYFWEKINRGGPQIAGAATDKLLVWNEDWQLIGEGINHNLRAKEDIFGIDLELVPLKDPIIHDTSGIIKKGKGKGVASHYYSITRLLTKGAIIISGKKLQVDGISWMDHEFFTHQMSEEQGGWDWFSIQLDNQTEIMLYNLRLKEGFIDSISGGTFIDKHGNATHLKRSEFEILPLDSWMSKKSMARYPSGWRISIPDYKLSLEIKPTFKNQELITKQAIYWEGSCIVSGNHKGRKITGQAYTELTGYNDSL